MKMANIQLLMYRLDSGLWLHTMGNNIPALFDIEGVEVSVLHTEWELKWPQSKDMIY